MSKIALQDLENFVSIGHVALSPDKKRIAFDAANLDFEKDTYQNNLFLYERQTEKLHRIPSKGICWIDQSIQFYTALQYLGKDTELTIFPEGGHVFGWTGKPKHRRKRLQYKLKWCNEYLQ